MRLKVKILFMIAAGLLFFCGPMLGSAFAGPGAILTVSPGSASNPTNCSAENNGLPSTQRDGSNIDGTTYDIVYNFIVPNTTSTCSAKIGFTFGLTQTGFASSTPSFKFNLVGQGSASWSKSTMTLNQNSPPTSRGLNLSATGLTAIQKYTYTPSVQYASCSGCGGITPTVLMEGGANSNVGPVWLTGKVIINIYVDGQDQLGITAQQSDGGVNCSSGDVETFNTPTMVNEGSVDQWVYTYNVNAGQTVCDSALITLQVLNSDSAGDAPSPNPKDRYPIDITCDPSTDTTGPASSPGFCADINVKPPVFPYSMTDGGSGATFGFDFKTAALTNPGTYNLFLQVSDTHTNDDLSKPFLDCAPETGCSSPVDSDGFVDVQIVVSSATPATQAFFSDGNFGGLLNCDNEPTKSDDGVTFAIVPGGKGKGTIEATNPGEFFYNLIWTNTTKDPTNLTFSVPTSDNVTSKGANPVHAYNFNAAGFDPSVDNPSTASGPGIPCADPTSATNTCTIEVPGGDVVWIVWHVSYSRIGNSTSGLPKLSDVCPSPKSTPSGTIGDPNNIYAIGQITYTGLTNPITSSASAWGYLKH